MAKKNFNITAFLLLALVLLWQYSVYAESATILEIVTSKTIKTTVRIAVATTNIEAVKKKLINKIRQMDNEKFKIKYAQLYKIVKDLPPGIKVAYNVTPNMTKEQMIDNIKSLDKKEVYRLISRLPDKTVSDLFKLYLREMRHN